MVERIIFQSLEDGFKKKVQMLARANGETVSELMRRLANKEMLVCRDKIEAIKEIEEKEFLKKQSLIQNSTLTEQQRNYVDDLNDDSITF